MSASYDLTQNKTIANLNKDTTASPNGDGGAIPMTNLDYNIPADDDYRSLGGQKRRTLLDAEATNAMLMHLKPKEMTEIVVAPPEGKDDYSILPRAVDDKSRPSPDDNDDNQAEKASDPFDDDDDEDLDKKKVNIIAKVVIALQQSVVWLYKMMKKLTLGHPFFVAFVIAYICYFITALCYEYGSEGSKRLVGFTVLGVIIAVRNHVSRGCKALAIKAYGSDTLSARHSELLTKLRFFLRWLMYGALLAVAVWSLIEEGREKPENLRSLPGLLFFLLIPLLLSNNPGKINWHTVIWSLGLQFLCALFVLKWSFGKRCMVWTQDRFNEFFENAEAGSTFIFGDSYRDHYFVFGAFPVLFYSNATLTVLYYLGVMQFIIRVIGKFLRYIMETSAIESLSVAMGIFMDGFSTLLILRPFLLTLSKSQMFCVMTSVFSSLGGAYVAILASIGVSLEYLIPAMLLSAPATFAVCKLMIPETKDVADDDKNMDLCAEEKKKYLGIMDAAQTGAITMMAVVGNAVVVAFAFYSYVSWINHTLGWFGDRVGIDDLNIEYISSYLLYPAALAMGVEPDDCRNVGMLLGYRIGTYNIFAFIKLSELKVNKAKYMQYMLATNFTGPVSHSRDDMTLDLWNMTLSDGFISDRSEAIITYCLCGFSSFLAIAMAMGVMFAMVPERRKWVAQMAIPGLIAGNIANCMTGCFASFFY